MKNKLNTVVLIIELVAILFIAAVDGVAVVTGIKNAPVEVQEVAEQVVIEQEKAPEKRSIFAYDVPSGFKAINCSLPKETQEYAFYIASAYGVDFEIIMAVMSVESSFDPNAVSDSGDFGLMQINKCNAKWLKDEIGVDDLLNPYQNILAGTYILSGLYDKYQDTNKMLMAYNMGEAGAKKLWDNGVFETSYTRSVYRELGVDE